MNRMVWLYEFRGSINDWDLKILYKDLKCWKKIKWFVGLESWMVCNSMELEWNGL